MFITATEAQGQVRQRSEIQIGAKVQDGRQVQGQGQAEWSGQARVKNHRVRKREAGKRQLLMS
jgi:hypothetical protein